jgi:hypothetical protein
MTIVQLIWRVIWLQMGGQGVKLFYSIVVVH